MTFRDRAAGWINAVLHRFGLKLVVDRPIRDSQRLLRLKAEETGVRTFLDVGANQGQFGADLRRTGWKGRIVSFEPTSTAHRVLVERAAADRGGWVAAPRVAIGAAAGETVINLAKNSVSSSLLRVESRSTDAAPESAFESSESVDVRPLDSMMQPEWEAPFALKIDTQGFELEVLKGAPAILAQTTVVSLELSLSQLYEGGANLAEVYTFMEQAGFRCISLVEVFSDFVRHEVLQVDGTFVRSTPLGLAASRQGK